MRNFIVISNDVQMLTGKGEEWLVDKNGGVVAKFIDGNLASTAAHAYDNETTLVA